MTRVSATAALGNPAAKGRRRSCGVWALQPRHSKHTPGAIQRMRPVFGGGCSQCIPQSWSETLGAGQGGRGGPKHQWGQDRRDSAPALVKAPLRHWLGAFIVSRGTASPPPPQPGILQGCFALMWAGLAGPQVLPIDFHGDPVGHVWSWGWSVFLC